MFRLAKIEGGRINVHEPQMLTAGEAVTIGEALVLTGGKLTKCGTTTRPTYIALCTGEANTEIAVGRVESNQLYEVETPGTLTLGTKVTIDNNGLGITTTVTNGVAEVMYSDSQVTLVRF